METMPIKKLTMDYMTAHLMHEMSKPKKDKPQDMDAATVLRQDKGWNSSPRQSAKSYYYCGKPSHIAYFRYKTKKQEAKHKQRMHMTMTNLPSPLTTIALQDPICNGHLSCIINPPMTKLLAPVCTSKGLPKFANLSTGGKKNALLSSSRVWWQGSFHSRDSHFFLNKLDKVLATVKKSQMKQ